MKSEFTPFPNTEAGLTRVLEHTLSLRAAGFKTRAIERILSGFPVITIIAIPPTHGKREANRKALGESQC